MFNRDCKISIENYFKQQNKIKKKLNDLREECPDYVVQYFLQIETLSRINKLANCEYGDKFDKKRYLESLNIYSCESLKKII